MRPISQAIGVILVLIGLTTLVLTIIGYKPLPGSRNTDLFAAAFFLVMGVVSIRGLRGRTSNL